MTPNNTASICKKNCPFRVNEFEDYSRINSLIYNQRAKYE